MDERKKYEQDMTSLAMQAFEHHQIVQQSEGRWLLQRPHKDHWDDPKTRWDSIYATEIICTSHGGLYVDGDIDHVIFRYGPKHPEARVRWMGERCGAWDCYLHEKAIIGTGRERIDEWNPLVAQDDLEQLYKEIAESENPGKDVLTEIQDLMQWHINDGRDFVIRTLLYTGYFDEVPDVGMVVAPRVFYAHAALRRLCHLMDQKEE
jgi:hypothetical protein